MWWRVFIPTWRFFDVVGVHAELYVKVNGAWRPALTRPRFTWRSLFFNPAGGLYHARQNLLDRLVIEINEGAQPEHSVSFALVREIAAGREFKVTIDGEDFLLGASP